MRREDTAVALLWLLTLASSVAAVVYGLVYVTEAVVKLAVAIVGATAMMLAAILTHALTALREQRLEQQRQRQKNYADLLEKAAKYIRSRKSTRDEFETIHLFSWVVGSPEVICLTQKFMSNVTADSLRSLLVAMRRDIGLPAPPYDLSVASLFQEVEQPGKLG